MGKFEYTRITKGLINSVSATQQVMDKIFNNIPDTKVYLTQIFIATESMTDHLNALREVMKQAYEYNIKFNWNSCQLLIKEVFW